MGLAARYLHIPEPRSVILLRRLHTGSVNDYAAFSTLGIIGCVLALMV